MQTATRALARPEAIARARTMYEGGWAIEGIRQYLARNGIVVGWHTVKRWVDEEAALRERAAQKARQRRRFRDLHGVGIPRVLDEDGLLRRMRALRDAGLSTNAVARVIELDHGLPLNGDLVRRTELDGRLPLKVRKAVAA